MLDEETYKKELVRMWDMQRGNEYKGKNICDGVFCEDCPLSDINNDGRDGCMEPMKAFEIIKIVERWSKEHPPKKHKISKLEYDIIKACIDSRLDSCHFYDNGLLMTLLDKGYFKGADSEMELEYYFKDCDVVDDE